eukprot:CAMPEP_0119309394 /NCGR_PEP_ID=MMETSP1333-20130426/15292_1 /TAXON_ID=418940 /ORGANISM="Scyphosphaera apsteinii, Strain RCC1455" /LENGTH=162 /DNA_ID=CAMNT_0007313359 /DNA_START=144 /DNA_END=632 /DNA_ORIENTATION=-
MLAKKPTVKKQTDVLLLEDIKGIGRKGEVVQVKPAYAQNFIVSKGIGAIATPAILKDIEKQKAEAAAAEIAAKQQAQELAAKLQSVFREGAIIKKRVGPSGDIFGKVTSAHVANIIKERVGSEVNRKKIKVPDIKGAGSATATLTLHKEVAISLKIVVVAET